MGREKDTMAQINLLSPRVGKRIKRASIASHGKKISQKLFLRMYVICALIVVILLGVWGGLAVVTGQKEAALAMLKAQELKLKADPKELLEIKQQKEDLQARIRFLENLSAKKFLWFEKFDVIAQLMPDGVWIASIDLTKKTIEVDDEQAKAKKGKAPQKIQKEVITVSINGNAVAFTIQGAVELVGNFYENLKKHKPFSQDFSDIKLENISKSVVYGRDIMKFQIVCVIQ